MRHWTRKLRLVSYLVGREANEATIRGTSPLRSAAYEGHVDSAENYLQISSNKAVANSRRRYHAEMILEFLQIDQNR